MDKLITLDELRRPHPDQARIDSDSARLLRSTARRPGGRGGWSAVGMSDRKRRWRRPQPLPLVNGTS